LKIGEIGGGRGIRELGNWGIGKFGIGGYGIEN